MKFKHLVVPAVLMTVVASSLPAMAATNRSFVASYGNDANAVINSLDFARVGLPLNILAGCATIPAILWIFPLG